MTEEQIPGWLTGKSAIARYAGISTRQVGRLIASGKLKHLRLSGKLITSRPEDVDACFELMAEEHRTQNMSKDRDEFAA